MNPAAFISGLVLSVLLSLMAMLVALGCKPESGRWTAESVSMKNVAVETIGPKFIIVSGSNGLFGFSAKALTEQGLRTMNLALNVGLEVPYMLHNARRHIKPGRIFILPLEYELYSRTSGGTNLTLQLVGYDVDYLKKLSLLDQARFFTSISPLDRLRLLRARFLPTPRRSDPGLYDSKTINEFGDETSNIESRRNEALVRNIQKQKSRQTLTHSGKVWDQIGAFIADARAGGCEVFLTYPTIMKGFRNVEHDREFLRELQDRARSLGVPIIGTPETFQFEPQFVFDSSYHPIVQQQQANSLRLVKELRAAVPL